MSRAPLALVCALVLGCIHPPPDGATSTDPEAAFAEGIHLLTARDRKGRIDLAAARSRFRVAAEGGGRASSWFNLGWTEEALGEREQAVAAYRRAVAVDPAHEAAALSLARLVEEDGDIDEALEILSGLAAAAPGDPAAEGALRDALGRRGDVEKTSALARKALEAHPGDPEAYRALATAHAHAGAEGQSRLHLDKALALDAADPALHNDLGLAHLRSGNPTGAVQAFRAALRLDPDDYAANLNLGALALDSGDFGLARTCLEGALRARPGDVDARLGLAVILRASGALRKASQLYDDIIADAPDRPEPYLNATTLHTRYTRDYDQALRYLAALLARPGMPESRLADARRRVDLVTALKENQAEPAPEPETVGAADVASGIADLRATLAGQCVSQATRSEVAEWLEQLEGIVAAGDADMLGDAAFYLANLTERVDGEVADCASRER